LATAVYGSGAYRRDFRYAYDAEDNLWRVEEAGGTRTVTRTFDRRNRLTSETRDYARAVAYTYDAANNLKTLTDTGGRVTTYTYDAKNQLDTVVQNNQAIADYDWYSDGLLQKVSYQGCTNRNYLYDDADRITNITAIRQRTRLVTQVNGSMRKPA